jgi:hypothetical protein
MAEQRGDFFGIVAAVQHALPGVGEADQPTPDVEVLEQEALHVVGLHGSKRV